MGGTCSGKYVMCSESGEELEIKKIPARLKIPEGSCEKYIQCSAEVIVAPEKGPWCEKYIQCSAEGIVAPEKGPWCEKYVQCSAEGEMGLTEGCGKYVQCSRE
jgi:hypothetical protein